MKIFHVITVSELGGAQSVVANIAESLAGDHEVYILYGGNGEAWKFLDKRITRLKISGHRKGFSVKDIFLLVRLFYYRLKYKPDIVHLHSSKIGALGRIAFNPAKIVYTIHGFDSQRKAFRKFLFVEKLLRKRAASVVGISRYDVNNLKAEGITNDAVLIYNGIIDYSDEEPGNYNTDIIEKINKIRNRYPRLILCTARISKQKKFDLFVKIASEMPGYAFVWIGNKEPINGLPNNVFCIGEVHSAYLYLKYMDLFILPTNYEGLPISILESLAYGKPVIASNVSGIPEILNGLNGFAVENDVASFKEKIEYSFNDEVYSKMCDDARSSYLEKFTVDKMVNKYKTVYREVYEKKQK